MVYFSNIIEDVCFYSVLTAAVDLTNVFLFYALLKMSSLNSVEAADKGKVSSRRSLFTYIIFTAMKAYKFKIFLTRKPNSSLMRLSSNVLNYKPIDTRINKNMIGSIKQTCTHVWLSAAILSIQT